MLLKRLVVLALLVVSAVVAVAVGHSPHHCRCECFRRCKLLKLVDPHHCHCECFRHYKWTIASTTSVIALDSGIFARNEKNVLPWTSPLPRTDRVGGAEMPNARIDEAGRAVEPCSGRFSSNF